MEELLVEIESWKGQILWSSEIEGLFERPWREGSSS